MATDRARLLKRTQVSPAELGFDGELLRAWLDALGPLAIVDLETTGLSDDPAAEILEFGALLLDPGAAAITALESLVQPRGALPLAVQRLTGIGAADVAQAPPIEALAGEIAAALQGRAIVAHNAAFEQSFLARQVAGGLQGARYLDSQDLLSLVHPDAPDLRLETFTRTLLHSEERHRALSDAFDTLRVIAHIAADARAGSARCLTARRALERYAPNSPWLALFEGAPFASPDPVSHYVAIPPSSETPVPFDADAIAAVLADEARGRRHFPGYRVREGQIRMAREFVRLLSEGGCLLLEGGTGVGKSLAYLAAAIPFALERRAGGVREPVIVSTRTKILQDQLVGKDIPAAAALLGHPELRAISIKGRANYICRSRLDRVREEGREPSIFEEDRMAYAMLECCAATRRHGEVGAIPGAFHYRYPPLRDLLRRSVAARAEQCSREECARQRDCPFGARRAALASADLVVANHDLMLRWPPDYPPITHAIADEGHELVGVADEAYALSVQPVDLLDRFDELFGRGTREANEPTILPRKKLRALKRDVSAWRRTLQQDLSALGRLLDGDRVSRFGELDLRIDAAEQHPEAAQQARVCSGRLLALADEAERIANDDEAAGEREERLDTALGALREAATALERVFFAADEGSVACFERIEPPYDHWSLIVRHVVLSDLFHENFVDRLEALACVSASLFVGGKVEAALGELELESYRGMQARQLAVESPFDYPKHMRVAALDPRGNLIEETAQVIAQLARLLGGRTLGLFTSLERMRATAELLSAELQGEGFDILIQRGSKDDPGALVERFTRAAGGAVLLGSRSFWQGLDIQGPALQAVVIEKLPFERPTELHKRREARIEQAGGNAFARYGMAKMLLNLKQMSGRLIRSEEDRGIVVIVEGRTDKGYFRRLGEALPPGCTVLKARRDALPQLLREVGIETRD